MAAAENVTGIWDGVQPQCLGPTGVATYHSFHWQAHYTMAIPEKKREAIAAAAAPGGTGDIYAGLNEEEKSVLNEFISAGYPLQVIGNHSRLSICRWSIRSTFALRTRPTKTISGQSRATPGPIRRTI